MLQTSLLLMKNLNKTETPIFLSVVCSLFPKAIFLTYILKIKWQDRISDTEVLKRAGMQSVHTLLKLAQL